MLSVIILIVIMLIVIMLIFIRQSVVILRSISLHHAECHYASCIMLSWIRKHLFFTQTVIMLSVIMLDCHHDDFYQAKSQKTLAYAAIMLSVIMHAATMLSWTRKWLIFTQTVIMLIVIMLDCQHADFISQSLIILRGIC